jgi:putative glutamine amidotransferase
VTRPLIGVSSGFTDYGDYLGLAYARPLTRLGALPVVVPYLERAEDRAELLSRLDALILGVGRDLEPHRYGAAPHPSATAHSPWRDEVELALATEAMAAGVPLLGICRGMQVIDVALGGTLHPDHAVLPAPADRHPGGDWARWETVVAAALAGGEPPEHPGHPIAVAPDSALARALGTTAWVNSYHHQSLDRLGRGVRAVAHAPDGVIEAIEVPGARALTLGVQWELQEEARPGGAGEAVLALLLEAAGAIRLAA